MATIHIPESAAPLLPFCRTSGENGPHLWETFADMITFLASYAYGHDETPLAKPATLKGSNPIDLGVFRGRGLYPVLLTLAIAVQRDWRVAKEPDRISEIAERYAAAGARSLCPHGLTDTGAALAERLLADLRGNQTGYPHPVI
jgi:hypothetical protein